MSNKKWKIYYGDGSTFDDTQGEPEDAPGHNVQCIVFSDHDHGRTILQRFDWYFYRKGQNWWAGDLYGALDLFTNFPKEMSALKAGRSVDNEAYREILERAVQDPDFNEMTGHRDIDRNFTL